MASFFKSLQNKAFLFVFSKDQRLFCHITLALVSDDEMRLPKADFTIGLKYIGRVQLLWNELFPHCTQLQGSFTKSGKRITEQP